MALFGILKYARFISENEMLDLVSKVRLGVDLDIIDETKPELLNILLIASQKIIFKTYNKMKI